MNPSVELGFVFVEKHNHTGGFLAIISMFMCVCVCGQMLMLLFHNFWHTQTVVI